MFFTKSFTYEAVTVFRTHEQDIKNIKYLADPLVSATILTGLQHFAITVITSVITALSIGLQLSEITSIASAIVTICAGLQLLKTTLQGEKLSAGIGGGLPKA